MPVLLRGTVHRFRGFRRGVQMALLLALLWCGLPASIGQARAPSEAPGTALLLTEVSREEASLIEEKKSGAPQPMGAAEERLLRALEEDIGRHAGLLQLLGTAPYYSSQRALSVVLSRGETIAAAAARFDVEPEMVQAVLFQEMRFLNVLDEVDHCVAATHAYLDRLETYESLPPEERLYAEPPVRPVVFRLDSSTGLGQIFARTAIRALNWQAGREICDEEDWHDLSAIWARLRGDETYNIEMTALVLAYKRDLLCGQGLEPTALDIMQAYNGTGEASRWYRQVVSEHYRAFRAYSAGRSE